MNAGPATPSQQWMSPVETARRLGVSPKALRLYEARGLVDPVRTGAGWRAYGPAQVERLHRVLALKQLGLPLARIADLLSARDVRLDGVLALQEAALTSDRERLDRALSLIRIARGQLAAGATLSLDDLATLTKETTMTTAAMTNEDWQTTFEPLGKKYFTEAEMTAWRDQAGDFDQAEVGRRWQALIAEAKGLMTHSDPTSPEAIDLARRWKAEQDRSTQGDPKIAEKVSAMWRDAMSGPNAAKLPMDMALFDFVRKAGEAWRGTQGA